MSTKKDSKEEKEILDKETTQQETTKQADRDAK